MAKWSLKRTKEQSMNQIPGKGIGRFDDGQCAGAGLCRALERCNCSGPDAKGAANQRLGSLYFRHAQRVATIN